MEQSIEEYYINLIIRLQQEIDKMWKFIKEEGITEKYEKYDSKEN